MAREFSGVFATALATTDEFAAVVLTEDALAIEIAPTVNALDAFEIWAKMHSAGQFVKLAGAAADYTTPKGIVKAASGDPTTLASGGVAVILLVQLTSIYALSFRASSAVGAGSLAWKIRMG